MTHDELLAELTDTEPVYARATLYSALRAVVELHKPIKFRSPLKIRTGCAICEDNLQYPCPTIQAIEKELK